MLFDQFLQPLPGVLERCRETRKRPFEDDHPDDIVPHSRQQKDGHGDPARVTEHNAQHQEAHDHLQQMQERLQQMEANPVTNQTLFISIGSNDSICSQSRPGISSSLQTVVKEVSPVKRRRLYRIGW